MKAQFPYFVTRSQARATAKNLQANGKLAKVIDNGTAANVGQRWEVSMIGNTEHVEKKSAKKVKPSKKHNNKGWDIRKVETGIKAYDLYFDGDFILRRDTKFECYQEGVKIGNKNKVETKSLNY